jgi:hypothetical protein
MKRLPWRCLFTVVVGLMAFGGLSDNVQAKGMDSEDSDPVVISGGGGIFYPFKGKSGFNVVAQATGKISAQERWGVELEYRNYEAELFNAKDIDTQSYIVRGFGQYIFRSQGISPYVGLGLNIAVNVFDKKEIEKKRSSLNIKRGVGFGAGIMGVLGVEVPMGQQLAFFAEGRVSGDFQLTHYEKRSGKDKLSIESLSGLTGMGGIRLRF